MYIPPLFPLPPFRTAVIIRFVAICADSFPSNLNLTTVTVTVFAVSLLYSQIYIYKVYVYHEYGQF